MMGLARRDQVSPIRAMMDQATVIPVLTVERVQDAVPLAEALVDGGLTVLEVTLRTPAALEVITAMKRVKGAVVGAGTVTSPDTLDAALKAGSDFIVTPGVTPRLLDALVQCGAPCLPGGSTLSEALTLLDAGFAEQKFFPAEASGGVPAMKSFGGPLPQVTYCPTGGIKPDTAGGYLALPNVACVGGTWVAGKGDIDAANWEGVTAKARQAAGLSAPV